MSAISATAALEQGHRMGHRGRLAIADTAARRRQAMQLTRRQRLRLLLLSAAAFTATLVPLTLAAADVLQPLGISGGAAWQTVVLIVVLGIAAPLASLWLSILKVVGAGAGVAASLTLLAEGQLDEAAMLSLAYPATGLALSVLGTLMVHHILIEFEHEHERRACARFVPEQVVEQVLAKSDRQVMLGGEKVTGTIVFVDLRSFTTFSESRPAEQVIRVLNRYLSEISCAMLEHGGTVVSYLGDGLMAVFGAPLEQDDHADRALAAARELLDVRLPRANEWMQEEGLGDGFRLGIGINSGSFIAGNVGNNRRLEYTAIGDAANTASRIESLTKEAQLMLLVDRSTLLCLDRAAEDLYRVGEFDVRGRNGKVELWSRDVESGLAAA